MSDFLFEGRLERAARLFAEEAVRPIDAASLAEWAIGVAGRRADRGVISRLPRAWMLIAAAALIAAALAVTSFVGGRLSSDVVPPSPSGERT